MPHFGIVDSSSLLDAHPRRLPVGRPDPSVVCLVDYSAGLKPIPSSTGHRCRAQSERDPNRAGWTRGRTGNELRLSPLRLQPDFVALFQMVGGGLPRVDVEPRRPALPLLCPEISWSHG